MNIDGNLKINDVSCGTINSDSNINSEAITTKTIVLRDKMYLPYAVSQKDEIYEILKYFEEEITSLRDSQNAEQPEVGSLPIGTIIMSLSNNNIKYKQLGYVLCDGSTLWSIFSKYGNDAAYKARAIADILSNNNRNISWSTLKIPDFTNRFPRGTTNNNLICIGNVTFESIMNQITDVKSHINDENEEIVIKKYHQLETMISWASPLMYNNYLHAFVSLFDAGSVYFNEWSGGKI